MARTEPADQSPPVGELIRRLRLQAGMSQAEMAQHANIDSSSLSRIESGDRQASPKMLRAIAQVLGAPYADLLQASGVITAKSGRLTASNETQVTQLLRKIIRKMEHTGEGAAPSRRPVPIYDRVPAGLYKDASVVAAADEIMHVALSEEELDYDPRAFGLTVVGDSMVEAAILDGDLLIVSPNTRVKDGDIAVVNIAGATTVKKVFVDEQTVVLQACNSMFRPQVLRADEVEILGKVILVRRKLT